MGSPTKVQLISRKASEQWYINFPAAVAQAMEFKKGEVVEWIVADKGHLILARREVPTNPVDIKKNDT
jgi:bifunctional DNA-binding transcriptional regulator/antitoxin component of YhaV-PrlF toxin-antitoxin module